MCSYVASPCATLYSYILPYRFRLPCQILPRENEKPFSLYACGLRTYVCPFCLHITLYSAVSSHSLPFPWRRRTTHDNRDDSVALAVEWNLSENRSVSMPRNASARSVKGFTWSLPAAIFDVSIIKSRDCHVTSPFGDSFTIDTRGFTECCSKNVVWVASKKEIFAAKVDSARQKLCLGFHQVGS